jgi:hypothetical protein
MSAARDFLHYVESWHAALRWATGHVGRRFVGLFGVVSNVLAQGSKFAFANGLPGHAEQAPDALDQVGADRDLFRYRGEVKADWAARVQGAWDLYEQGGTWQVLAREIESWGSAAFPGTWTPNTIGIHEYEWAAFIVHIPHGLTGWGPPIEYDAGGAAYDDGSLYDFSGNPIDLDHIRRLIRKWKPARSKAYLRVYTEPTNTEFFDLDLRVS